MICPQCHSNRLDVKDSRPHTLGGVCIKRRRQCAVCKEKVITYEITDADLKKLHYDAKFVISQMHELIVHLSKTVGQQ